MWLLAKEIFSQISKRITNGKMTYLNTQKLKSVRLKKLKMKWTAKY